MDILEKGLEIVLSKSDCSQINKFVYILDGHIRNSMIKSRCVGKSAGNYSFTQNSSKHDPITTENKNIIRFILSTDARNFKLTQTISHIVVTVYILILKHFPTDKPQRHKNIQSNMFFQVVFFEHRSTKLSRFYFKLSSCMLFQKFNIFLPTLDHRNQPNPPQLENPIELEYQSNLVNKIHSDPE